MPYRHAQESIYRLLDTFKSDNYETEFTTFMTNLKEEIGFMLSEGSFVTQGHETTFVLDLHDWLLATVTKPPPYPNKDVIFNTIYTFGCEGRSFATTEISGIGCTSTDFDRAKEYCENTLQREVKETSKMCNYIECKNKKCPTFITNAAWKVDMRLVQIRSNDEPATAFYTCHNCWKNWRE